MRILTPEEYEAISPDFRGVWETERDDLPDWPLTRHLYIGKRTMMSSDGKCTLMIEGQSFVIIDDPHIQMRWVEVKFDDPLYDFGTSINGTRAEIAKYYNQPMNVNYDDSNEKTMTPIAVEFRHDEAFIRVDLNTMTSTLIQDEKPPKTQQQFAYEITSIRSRILAIINDVNSLSQEAHDAQLVNTASDLETCADDLTDAADCLEHRTVPPLG